MKRLLLLGALVGIGGCSDVFIVPEELAVEFQASKVPYQGQPPVNVAGGTGQVNVNGGLWTPCSGYQLSAEATGGDPITLRVTAAPSNPGGACLAVVEGFSYQTVLKNVSPGAHRVRVVHEVKPQAPAEVADVTVHVQ